MRYVVDTNVAVVANGQRSDATPECRIATIDFLENMMTSGTLIVDLAGEVEAEYKKNLSFGQPGVGNRFIQAFLTTASSRLTRVDITKNRQGEFTDFPVTGSLRRFDQSDRKFAALAIRAKCPVANAVDTDWLEHLTDLTAIGVVVEFLCSTDVKKWLKK
ncbi:hypothetical protein [Hansschlegelia plantiphila]|uniref:PIN domain-containing protein n=1 Tax=Hansschlegelia plantiphila TaxID=374655 RepID=A0A9W6MV79_9HYPH|nr:hypothetical protein [Hansschlegelia plantiphila]GLK67662.1 hypothetical protein GCM10008179_13000 [Hansschlegelia plantiphila]